MERHGRVYLLYGREDLICDIRPIRFCGVSVQPASEALMLRFIYTIIVNIFRILYYAPTMEHYAKHPEKYSAEDKYALAQRLIKTVKRTGRITTEYYGVENLPKDGGYIMFANHQGRYDALGVISGHKRPCSFLITRFRANQFLAKQFFDMMGGISIDRDSVKDQMRALRELARNVKEGKIYLVFPEGIYEKGQRNRLLEFKHGCFLSAKNAKCPIVPVALIDSYKVFGVNSLKKVTSKVVYLEPIEYEEYNGMHVKEISEMVKGRIAEAIEKYSE